MNLNNHPTLQQLCDLYIQCNDEAAHHILWVDNVGEVRVTPLPEDINPAGFEDRFPTVLLRFETFQVGNGYVGPEAAGDKDHMNRMFSALVREWKEQNGSPQRRYIDSF